MRALHLLIFLLLITSAVHAYGPEHYDADTGGVETGLLDDDGDRNPGTQFDIDALGLSGDVAIISFVENGDRGTGNPKNTFEQTGGGRIIDVTDLGACASGTACVNGRNFDTLAADNTLAFQKAITFVLTTLYQSGCAGTCNTYNLGDPGGTKNYIIYVPNGTYLVSDTLSYKTNWNGNPLWINGVSYDQSFLYIDHASVVDDIGVVQDASSLPAGNYSEAFARLRIIGQSRSLTILKAYGSSWGNKPVISFGNPISANNSSVAYSTLRNMTINVNARGATGVQFSGANNSGMHNLMIYGSNGNSSAYGIYIKSGASLGYHNDILIKDFKTAIYSEPYHAAHSTFEHITIENLDTSSTEASIRVLDSGVSLRKIKVTRASCAKPIKIERAGQSVLIDSWLDTTGSGCYTTLNDAIDITSVGHVHTRGIRLEDSNDSFDEDCSNRTATVTELGSTISCAAAGDPSTLAILPANPSRYKNYQSFTPVIIHDEDDLQECFGIGSYSSNPSCPDSDTYVLFFPEESYNFVGSINGGPPYEVPPQIKVMNFLYGGFSTAGDASGKYLFKASSGSIEDGSLYIEDITSSGPLFAHYSTGTRPLVLRHLGGAGKIYQNISSKRQTVYFESVGGLGKNIPFGNLNAWARSINTEMSSTGGVDPIKANFPLGGGTSLWVMGYKTEKNQPSFSLSDSDDRLEVLGGFANQRAGAFAVINDGDDPDEIPYSVLVLKESAVNAKSSYIGFTSGIGEGGCTQDNPEFHFDIITRQKINSAWQETLWSSYPQRNITNRCNDIFVPLFVANDDSGVRFVDDDSACVSSCGLSWASAYSKISEAVNDLNTRPGGGTIYVDSGVYIESSVALDPATVTLHKPIKIVGAGMAVTSWEYDDTQGAALKITADGSGSQISKLAIRPTSGSAKTSLENGGIYIDGGDNILIDNVLVWQFGNNGRSTTSYSDPESGASYCLKVNGGADNIKVINSQFTFCNNALVLLDLEDNGAFEFDRSVTHFTRAGPALYVDDAVDSSVEIKVTSSWFAMKDSATANKEYSKYLVYLNGGHSVFANTETELDNAEHNMKSHHIYVGTNNNSFTNQMFVAGENPDGPTPCNSNIPPYALNIAGNHNRVLQHIVTSEGGCGAPEIHDVGINNTIWTGYPPATP